ncbi:hypothetical protein [Alteribacter natronophilus]|nr:hypothetical protein [Alteribacter natronophilus]
MPEKPAGTEYMDISRQGVFVYIVVIDQINYAAKGGDSCGNSIR